MKTPLIILLPIIASCLAPPDRLTITGGRGSGDITSEKGISFEEDAHWIAIGVELPVRWSRPERAQRPPPPPQFPSPAEAFPELLGAPEKPVTEPPWWEDFSLVQSLFLLLAGGAVAKGAGPVYQRFKKKTP